MTISTGVSVVACDKGETIKEIQKNGKSAYDIAVEGGYKGTLDEWLKSLKGIKGYKGDRGEKGEKGDPGKDGKSVDPKDVKKIIDDLCKKQQKENEEKLNDLIYQNYFSHLDFLETIKSTGSLSDNKQNKRNELRLKIFTRIVEDIKTKLKEPIVVFDREKVMEGFLNLKTGKYAKEANLLGITYKFDSILFKTKVKVILWENGQWAETVDISFWSIIS